MQQSVSPNALHFLAFSIFLCDGASVTFACVTNSSGNWTLKDSTHCATSYALSTPTDVNEYEQQPSYPGPIPLESSPKAHVHPCIVDQPLRGDPDPHHLLSFFPR